MRPVNLKTKIFLDGGDPNETREVINLLGFLDGQTTNPTLIAKTFQNSAGNPLDFYKKVVKEISQLIPDGSVSVEVVDEDMLAQAKEMNSWIPNAHIKFPVNEAGLAAAEQAVKMSIRVNMTLIFTQEQAAAVYAATKGGDVFVSPFVGRLDDKGENGMDLVKNILKMYQGSDGHVAVLTASVRNLNHFLQALVLGSDIITAPFKILKEWKEGGMQIPKSIPYQDLDLNQDWHKFDVRHELTDKGIEKFASDWNALIK